MHYLRHKHLCCFGRNGRIVDFDDRRKTFESVLEINGDYLNKGCAENVCAGGTVYSIKTKQEEHIVYCNFNGIMTPVKVSFANYIDEHGVEIYKADCINLNNGDSIDYEEICGAEEC